jgi:hypothetical protein
MPRSFKWSRTNIKPKRMIPNVYWRCECCGMQCCAGGQVGQTFWRTVMPISSEARSSRRLGSSATLCESPKPYKCLFSIYSTTLSIVHIKYHWMIHWSVNEVEKDMEFCGSDISILLCIWQVITSKLSQQTAYLHSNFFTFHPEKVGMLLPICHGYLTPHHYYFATLMITLPIDANLAWFIVSLNNPRIIKRIAL